MIDQNTDFFAYVDNFAKIDGIEPIKVFGNEDSSADYTIAIPTYRRTEYLKEAIDSALNQDCNFSYNVIVVDNNPERNDDTEKMMASYKNTKNLSYYKNAENLGMAGNWNRLFQLAKTKWVIMLHDDDVLYPYYISACNKIISQYKDIGILKPKEDKVFNVSKFTDGKLKKIKCINFYYGNSYGTPSGMLFNRDKVIEVGGYNQDFYPSLDYCFNARFSTLYDFIYFDTPLMYYRIGVNESLKVETQRQWLINDSYLIRQILKKYNFPQIIVDYFVAFRTMRTYDLLKRTFNSDFKFELSEIGLKNKFFWCGFLSHIYIKRKTKIIED